MSADAGLPLYNDQKEGNRTNGEEMSGVVYEKIATENEDTVSGNINNAAHTTVATGAYANGVTKKEDNLKSGVNLKERLKSLDAFRGLVIAVMILVNAGGSLYNGGLSHAMWDGALLADFVMPFFLFVVGISMSLSFKRIMTKEFDSIRKIKFKILKKATVRAIKLFVLGLIVQGGGFPYSVQYDISRMRYFGILQRIAISYFVCTVMELYIPQTKKIQGYFRLYTRYVWHWMFAILTLVIHIALLYGVDTSSIDPDECGTGMLDPKCNSVGYLDRKICGIEHIYNFPTYRALYEECSVSDYPDWCAFEPEGFISTIPTIFTTWVGLHFGHALYDTHGNHMERMAQWGPQSLIFLILSIIFHYTWIPYNKNLWSISYNFMMCGCCGILLMIFYFIIDIKKMTRVTAPLIWMGMNAIFIYVLGASSWGESIIRWFYYEDTYKNLINLLQDHVFRYNRQPTPYGSPTNDDGVFAYIMVKIAFWFVVAGIMYKKRIFYKI